MTKHGLVYVKKFQQIDFIRYNLLPLWNVGSATTQVGIVLYDEHQFKHFGDFEYANDDELEADLFRAYRFFTESDPSITRLVLSILFLTLTRHQLYFLFLAR